MTTPPKPAAKKPAAKRPTRAKAPTKAAALKALGLTQEDLDSLKVLAELRAKTDEPVPSSPEAEIVPSPQPPPVSEPGVFYARNLRQVDVGLRLDRQQGERKKRFDLKPRGQRGDLVRLDKDDLNDGALISNIEYGVVEIITAHEAQEAISKQVSNQQTRVHPAMAMLRNELGQSYEADQIKVDPEFNSQGITVAHLDPNQINGKLSDREVKQGQGFQRVNPGQENQGFASPGGNPGIISDGFQRNDSAVTADAIARRKDIEGPAAGVGGLRVTVDPVQKT